MNDLTEEMFVEGTIKPSNNIKTDFTRPSFLIATCSMLLTLLLWVVAPKWHLIPECFGFYSLGAWTSEVNINLNYGGRNREQLLRWVNELEELLKNEI